MPIDIIKPFRNIVDKARKPAGAIGTLVVPLSQVGGLVMWNGNAGLAPWPGVRFRVSPEWLIPVAFVEASGAPGRRRTLAARSAASDGTG